MWGKIHEQITRNKKQSTQIMKTITNRPKPNLYSTPKKRSHNQFPVLNYHHWLVKTTIMPNWKFNNVGKTIINHPPNHHQ
jgi:hypothetical protein